MFRVEISLYNTEFIPRINIRNRETLASKKKDFR